LDEVIPPPVFPEIVLAMIVRVPLPLSIPPPLLFEMVLSVTVIMPSFSMPTPEVRSPRPR
jgi:hypothetical protein